MAAPSTGKDVLHSVIFGLFCGGLFWIGSGAISLLGCGRPSNKPSNQPQAQVAPAGMTTSRVVEHLVRQQAGAIANDVLQTCRDTAQGDPNATLAVPLEFTVHARTAELMRIEFTNALKPFGEDLSGVPAERVNAALAAKTKAVISALYSEFVNPVLSRKFRAR